jgi:PDDEXK-like domain of unknown function (DUF3799)
VQKLNLGINAGLTNAEYHAEREHLSSSNLKLLLESPQQFYKQKILGEKESKSSAAMDLGSYVHTLILEPENVQAEYAFYEGWRKQGKEFDAFKQEAGNKIVISKPQAHTGQLMANTVKACPPALDLLKGGVAELSLASRILDVPVKMRADYLQPEKGYVLDVKTTRYPNDPFTFKQTCRGLGYDLSAALYCEIAHNIYGKLFDFYWLVISKTDMSAAVYKASSTTLTEGASLVNKALVTYKKCLSSNTWPDSVDEVLRQQVSEHEIIEI